MIRINKPDTPPKTLQEKGQKATQKDLQLYESSSELSRSKKDFFSFDSTIYTHSSVKEILKVSQYDKCCFCERKIELKDVEHYRPKAAYQSDSETDLIRPGYFWLAYDWDNLLLSCAICNRSYKKNWFPIEDEKTRAKSPDQSLDQEVPLIINPTKENPEKFIEFIGDKPKAIDGNIKGTKTIEKIGLNRPFLDERRFEHYKNCKYLYKLIQLFDAKENLDRNEKKLVTEARHLLSKYVLASSEYAGMIRSAIRHKFKY